MTILDSALRRVIATGTGAFRPYDRFGEVIEDLSWLPLSSESEGGGPGCFMIRFEPGASSRPHVHNEIEEFYMLEGEIEDCDGRVLKAGDFVRYEPGSQHFSTSPKGCLMLVVLRAPNEAL